MTLNNLTYQYAKQRMSKVQKWINKHSHNLRHNNQNTHTISEYGHNNTIGAQHSEKNGVLNFVYFMMSMLCSR